jgi:predicted RND superfamily exporter protein
MRTGIERHLIAMTRLFFRHPWKTLFLVSVLFGLTASQLPKTSIDMSTEALLYEDDPQRLAYDQFHQEFGDDRVILLTITAPDIFNEPFFLKLRALTREIEAKVPYVKKVHSLITARDVWGDDRKLHVDELMTDLSVKPIDYGALEQKVLNHPYYQSHLISKEGKTTAVIIEIEAVTDEAVADIDAAAILNPELFEPDSKAAAETRYIDETENHEVVSAIDSIISGYQAPDFTMALSGTPVVLEVYNQVTLKDMVKCAVILLAVVILLLFFLFRRLCGILLPLTIVVAALFSALGSMAFFQIPIKMMSTVLPSFILSVGIADAVHILTHFFRYFSRGETKEDAIALAVKHSGVAVLMTSLTTSAGLLSFSFAEMAAITEMGIYATVGVGFTLFYTLAITPAVLALLPIKPHAEKNRQHHLFDRILERFGRLATTRPRMITGFSLLLLVVAGSLLVQLRISEHVLKYFPDHMPVKQDALYIQENLDGLLTFEIIVDTGKKNGLYEPAVLNRIEDTVKRLKQLKDPASGFYVGNVIAITDLIKEVHQALNNNDPKFYTIAQDRAVVAQELFLFELSGADDLKAIADSDFSKTRISVKVPWIGTVDLSRMLARMQSILQDVFKDDDRYAVTGSSAMLARTYQATLNSMSYSYLIAFVVISLMLILLVGDVRIGLASVLPNILPIMIVMAFLAAFDITLDMTSMMIGSIAMGLVVDDSLHFIYNYRNMWMQSGDPRHAVKETLKTTGRALLMTSVVLAFGFFSLLSASLLYLVQFGLLLGAIILMALVADFLFLPALLVLCTGKPKQSKVALGEACS